jgi:hypothetical protein
MSSINLPYPLTGGSFSSNVTVSNPCVEVPIGSSYFPTVQRERFRELANNVSEDDAQKILNFLLTESTKEGSIQLSESTVNALVLMVTDSCVALPTEKR